MRSPDASTDARALQFFEPEPDVVFNIDTTARLAHVSRRMILIYCKHGLVAAVGDSARMGYVFDGEAVRTLRRIGSLRVICGNDWAGIGIILRLVNELEHLREVVDITTFTRMENDS